MREKIEEEVERHKKFQSGLLGIKGQLMKVGETRSRVIFSGALGRNRTGITAFGGPHPIR